MRKDTSVRRTMALEMLSRAGLTPYDYAPPIYRLLWRLGVDIPPPYFMNFGKLALFQGAAFFVGIAIGMTLLTALLLPGFPILLTLVLSLLGGGSWPLTMTRGEGNSVSRHGTIFRHPALRLFRHLELKQ